MAQYSYDRRVEGGGANAFKVFVILAFILFIIALATPTSRNSQSILNTGERGRECGGSIVAQPGETVASLAYRCNTTTTTILQLNPALHSARDSVTGMTVRLDDNHTGVTVVSSPSQQVANPVIVVQPEIVQVPVTGNSVVVANPRARFTYTVQPGDTLFSLSRGFGTSVDAIVAANPGVIYDPDWVLAGTVIWIP